ncbi:MAG: Nif11-like leader peptide family natural product precursor [Cyanobacteriota bacterium]|jgi:hypothetical protein
MSWVELERLVTDAEADAELRRILRSCPSQADLLLAARRRGYHITRVDLLRAWQRHQQRSSQRASSG